MVISMVVMTLEEMFFIDRLAEGLKFSSYVNLAVLTDSVLKSFIDCALQSILPMQINKRMDKSRFIVKQNGKASICHNKTLMKVRSLSIISKTLSSNMSVRTIQRQLPDRHKDRK